MEDGEQVLCVRGKLNKLFKTRSGETGGKPWKFQDGELAGDGAHVKITFANREDNIPQTWVGQEVVIECSKSEKHGWIGAKIKANEYPEGTFNNVLWVTSTGIVTCPAMEGGETGGSDDGDVAPQKENESGFKSRYGGDDEGEKPKRTEAPPKKEFPSKEERLAEQSQLQKNKVTLLWRAQHRIVKEGSVCRAELEKEGVVMTDEHFQAACASVFIALDRGGMA